jgi:hypothetical protein
MVNIPDIPSKLFTTFNDIVFHDEPHKYYLKGSDKPLTSVTTMVGRYESEFQEDHWAEKKAIDYGLTSEEVKAFWNWDNARATTKGSLIHNYLENRFLNKKFPYDLDMILNNFGCDVIKQEYDVTLQQADAFVEMSKNRLIPIKVEYVVYDEELLLAGMVDMLFYNVKMREFQIWDWKTNKRFDFDSRYDMSGKLSLLKDSHLNHYSLQLGTYKYIIEKHTGIKLGQSHLVWFSNLRDEFKVIPTKNMDYYVNIMLEEQKEFALAA